MSEGWDTYVIDPPRADEDFLSKDCVLRECWTDMENARAAFAPGWCRNRLITDPGSLGSRASNPRQRRRMIMTEQLETGSPHAAEFDAQLKSDTPLIDVVRWWDHVAGPNIRMDMVQVLSSAEAAAYTLTLYEGWDTYVIDPDRAADPFFESQDRIMHDSWTKLENARAALRQASA
jgi:hypothetical protein